MKKGPIISIVIAIVLIGLAVFLFMAPGKPGKLDVFAQCVKDSGAIFYGAFWCPHCREQKALFGRSQQYLPYEECSTPDGKSQLQLCVDKGIKGYPTWDFPDGTRKDKLLSLEELSELTKCELPQ